MIPDRIDLPPETRLSHWIELPAQGSFLGWQQAQQRVLCYVNALNVDPVQGAAIAHRALRLALADDRTRNAPALSPVAASMRALRCILADSQMKPAPPQTETVLRWDHMPEKMRLMVKFIVNDPAVCALDIAGHDGQMWPLMPEFQRGIMKSENISGVTPLKSAKAMLSQGLRFGWYKIKGIARRHHS